jgi:hypothetical protein
VLQRLRTYQLARVVRYMKETLGTMPRRTRSAVRWWLDRREGDPAWFDEVALRNSRNLKYLYATLRIAPSKRAGRILFENDPPPDSRPAVVKRLARETNTLAVAEGIIRNRIDFARPIGDLVVNLSQIRCEPSRSAGVDSLGDAKASASTGSARWFNPRRKREEPPRRDLSNLDRASRLRLAFYRLYLFARFLQKVLVEGFQIVCETQHLKTVAITDGPEFQLRPLILVPVAILLGLVVPRRTLVEAHVAGDLVHRPIDAGCPAT